MDLRRFLFDKRISQREIVRAAAGHVDHADLSRIVNRVRKPSARLRALIVDALVSLGFDRSKVEALKELRT